MASRPTSCTASAKLLSAEQWNAALRQVAPLPDYMVIDGARVGREKRDGIDVLDPAVGRAIGAVPAGSAADVDLAVISSRRAFRASWSRTKPVERARVLYRTAAAIRSKSERLSVIEVLDCGKPLREARGDVETAARYFGYYAGMRQRRGSLPQPRQELLPCLLPCSGSVDCGCRRSFLERPVRQQRPLISCRGSRLDCES